MIDLCDPSLESPFLKDGQPHVVFGRSEELDPIFRFVWDADLLIEYPFAMARWVDAPDGEEEFSVTMFSEDEVRILAVWATRMAHEQFELNRGHG